MAGRVLVIGGGLAGSIAALAAKEAGADVKMVYKSFGRTALSSGLLSLADSRAGDGISASLAEMLSRNSRRPLAAFQNPEAALFEALYLFLSHTSGLYPENIAIEKEAKRYPTELGGVEKAQLAPLSFFTPDDFKDGAEVPFIVSLSGYGRFRAMFLAGAWSEAMSMGGAGEAFCILPLAFDHDGRPFGSPSALAAYLDSDDGLEQLAKAVKSALGARKPACLVFPPVLGLNRISLPAELSDKLGIAVKEAAPAQDSVPGVRLLQKLHQSLEESGISLMKGGANGYKIENGRIKAVSVKGRDGSSQDISADAFILASGKYLGGGITFNKGAFSETLFDLPVFLDSDQLKDIFIGRMTELDYRMTQRFSRVGIETDEKGRALGRDRGPFLENLFAAGHVLGGFDPVADAADGVDLATGLLVGKAAGGELP